MSTRSFIIAAVFVFALLSPVALPQVRAEARRPDVGPGHVVWFDLSTPDLARSEKFYGQLFGWTFRPVPGTDLAVEINAGATGVGTLRQAEGKISAFNGVVYVQVDELEASCKRATDLGGTLVEGFPFNLPNAAGAVALVLDPVGHPIGLYSRTPLPPASPAAK